MKAMYRCRRLHSCCYANVLDDYILVNGDLYRGQVRVDKHRYLSMLPLGPGKVLLLEDSRDTNCYSLVTLDQDGGRVSHELPSTAIQPHLLFADHQAAYMMTASVYFGRYLFAERTLSQVADGDPLMEHMRLSVLVSLRASLHLPSLIGCRNGQPVAISDTGSSDGNLSLLVDGRQVTLPIPCRHGYLIAAYYIEDNVYVTMKRSQSLYDHYWLEPWLWRPAEHTVLSPQQRLMVRQLFCLQHHRQLPVPKDLLPLIVNYTLS